MGHASSHSLHAASEHDRVVGGAGHALVNADAPPLRFHRKHGDNIVLASGGFRALRPESFCKGICFTDRPVVVGEKIVLRLTELSSRWSGVIRIGFTSHNPGHLGSITLPTCPSTLLPFGRRASSRR